MIEVAGRPVSRETSEALDGFEVLLRHWQRRINLVSPQSLSDLRERHIADSLQLLDLLPAGTTSWADLGSGAGFPGVPCAIALAETDPDIAMSLVESDQRKATFLREVTRRYCPAVSVLSRRAEDVPPLASSMVTARALAPLDRLLPLVARHLAPDGTALLPKGANWEKEVEAVTPIWHFDLTVHPGRVDPSGVLLQFRGLARAPV